MQRFVPSGCQPAFLNHWDMYFFCRAIDICRRSQVDVSSTVHQRKSQRRVHENLTKLVRASASAANLQDVACAMASSTAGGGNTSGPA